MDLGSLAARRPGSGFRPLDGLLGLAFAFIWGTGYVETGGEGRILEFVGAYRVQGSWMVNQIEN